MHEYPLTRRLAAAALGRSCFLAAGVLLRLPTWLSSRLLGAVAWLLGCESSAPELRSGTARPYSSCGAGVGGILAQMSQVIAAGGEEARVLKAVLAHIGSAEALALVRGGLMRQSRSSSIERGGGGKAFPEYASAPSIEARRLFLDGAVGEPAQFFAKVQAHPGCLERPEFWRARDAWLKEPVLNRVPAALWMLGPAAEIRLEHFESDHAMIWVVLIRHAQDRRQSILEISVSQGVTRRGLPAIFDRFECTGMDGFIRVNGICMTSDHAPPLEIHRGAEEISQRQFEGTARLGKRFEAEELEAILRQSERLCLLL